MFAFVSLLLQQLERTNILPLNALIYFLRFAIDIPLYPLVKTLILSANNILVLSGDSGGPTPAIINKIK